MLYIRSPGGEAIGGKAYLFRILLCRANYTDEGRGFVPCFLRAFPANAVALVAFEGAMRNLP